MTRICKEMARSFSKSVFVRLLIIICVVVIFSMILSALQLLDSDITSCSVLEDHSKLQQSRFRQKVVSIPRHIHQIYFNVTKTSMPERFQDVKASWKRCHPDFKYTLWNETMVEHLIDVNYSAMKDLYNSYGHWVRRVDVARMFILHTYGGIYIDMDIKCRDGIQGLLAIIPTYAGVGLYNTQPFGVASDFIIARKRHPFIRHLLCSLRKANRNYLLPFVTTMMSTGPVFISLCLYTYENKNDIYLYSSQTVSRFVRHVEGETWHQLDGQILWWLFNNGMALIEAFGCALVCVVLFRYLYKRYIHLKAEEIYSKRIS